MRCRLCGEGVRNLRTAEKHDGCRRNTEAAHGLPRMMLLQLAISVRAGDENAPVKRYVH